MAGTRELMCAFQPKYEADIRLAADSTLRGDAPVFIPYDVLTPQQIYGDHSSNPYAYPQGYVGQVATPELQAVPHDREDVQWPDYLRTFEEEGRSEDRGPWADPTMHPHLQYSEDTQPDPAAFGPGEYARASDLVWRHDYPLTQAGNPIAEPQFEKPVSAVTGADVVFRAPNSRGAVVAQTPQTPDDESFLDPLLRSSHRRAIRSVFKATAKESGKRQQIEDAAPMSLSQVEPQAIPSTQSFQAGDVSLLDPRMRAHTNPATANTSPKSIKRKENVMPADNDRSTPKHLDQSQSVPLGHGPHAAIQIGAQTGNITNTHLGNGIGVHAGLRINTRAILTKGQEVEAAKEKTALRPTTALPTNVYSINPLIGRPPAILRKEGCLKQQNSNWFSEFTVDELLYNAHPDDLCGTLIIEVAKYYSGPEIAVHANHLYGLLGKKAKTENNYTKRISNAVMHLCKNDKTDHASVIDAMQQDRTIFRVHGQPGTKTEETIQEILAAQAEVAQRARIAKAAAEAAQFAREKKAARERARMSEGSAPLLPIPTYASMPQNAYMVASDPLLSSTSQTTSIMRSPAPVVAPAPAKRKRAIADQDDERVPRKKQVKDNDATRRCSSEE